MDGIIQNHTASSSRFKLGRNRPIAHGPRFRLRNYLTRAVVPPPAVCDYSAQAAAALSQRYGNNQLGDCVIAGMAHAVGVFTGNAGANPYIFGSDDIISLYEAIGGYNPDDPSTDRGCDEVTAMNYWQNNGAPAGSHAIAAYMEVNPQDPMEYRTALWLFENLLLTFEMPDVWYNPPQPLQNGFVWDVSGPSDPRLGHAVTGVGYNAQGVTIATWGMTGLLTDAAVATYATQAANGGLYTVISKDTLNQLTQQAPAGFDWSQLVADFDSMGGNA